jgi:hypothetical protein
MQASPDWSTISPEGGGVYIKVGYYGDDPATIKFYIPANVRVVGDTTTAPYIYEATMNSGGAMTLILGSNVPGTYYIAAYTPNAIISHPITVLFVESGGGGGVLPPPPDT